jgi:hypothetical protein
VRIECHETEDTSRDEALLLVEGQPVWNSSIRSGESANLTGVSPHNFEGEIEMTLLDLDSGIFGDSHDTLGRVTIRAGEADTGEHTAVFAEDGASYDLRYHVNSETVPVPEGDVVQLVSLQCQETEDSTGADEAYLRVNGRFVWGPQSMNDGEYEQINGRNVFAFGSDDTIQVELFDEDTGFWDDDDQIDTLVIESTEISESQPISKILEGDGAKYTLRYRVY